MAATWFIIRSEASEQALQTALHYACGAGADCEPIKSSGLCFLPNTIQAHASYAFNSYYQRKATVPGSSDFSGTATVAKTDPNYGSCVYPTSSSTVGGTLPPGRNNHTDHNSNYKCTTLLPDFGTGGVNLGMGPVNFGTGGVNLGIGPVLPDAMPSKASLESSNYAYVDSSIFDSYSLDYFVTHVDQSLSTTTISQCGN